MFVLLQIRLQSDTVSFHNFKSQNSKLSVSNPKSRYVPYLSVLSQISNCQGLGRKNKHEILTTDRSISCYRLRSYLFTPTDSTWMAHAFVGRAAIALRLGANTQCVCMISIVIIISIYKYIQ